MNKNVIGSISGNNFAENTVIQGQNVNQNMNNNREEFAQAFEVLLKDIKGIQDETKREQAEFYADRLKVANESNDPSTAKKMIKFLMNSLGTVGSLISISELISK
ncbi:MULTISPECIES: hypothetical protein [unclassified Exiguobacterium]|uniref:hypothetical protein n=1 Tax=unclassified Exiguobacterium TaxID=2644629 RepID=UPI001BE7E5EB|nr:MULTISPECIES: hypothetical protein [unclassified Exiguobacterium]